MMKWLNIFMIKMMAIAGGAAKNWRLQITEGWGRKGPGK
jgi:hypothetical protein